MRVHVIKNNAGCSTDLIVAAAAVSNEALFTVSLQTSRKCRVSAKLWALITFASLTFLPSDSPFRPLLVCLAVPAAPWPWCPCSASGPFPPKPLWMSRVCGLLQFFWGDGGGLSFTWPPPPPWRSFSFFCRRSYVLLVLSSRCTNWGRPCGEWDSAETETWERVVIKPHNRKSVCRKIKGCPGKKRANYVGTRKITFNLKT